MLTRTLRPFLVALLGQGLLVAAASLESYHLTLSDVLRITVFWSTAFAALTGITVTLAHGTVVRSRRPRLTSLAFSILLAVVS